MIRRVTTRRLIGKSDWIQRLLRAQLKEFVAKDRLYIAVLHDSLLASVGNGVYTCLDGILPLVHRKVMIYVTPVTWDGMTLSTDTFRDDPVVMSDCKHPTIVKTVGHKGSIVLYMSSKEHKYQLQQLIDGNANTD